MLKEKIKSAVNVFHNMYPKENPIIDVGCREAYSVVYLRKKGYTVVGVDVDKKWKNYKGRGTVCADFTAMKIKPPVGAIFSRHSIEHLDTVAFFNKCLEILGSNGVVFIILPLTQWALLNRGLDDEVDKISDEDAMADFREASKAFKEIHFCRTEELGIMRMDDDWVYVGRKNG